jgi:phage-related baseplate assembly protein
MRDEYFAAWLSTTYKTHAGATLVVAAQRDAVSRCRRVEASEGDLDAHYERDQMRDLVARFTFSRHDVAPADEIEILGDVYEGTASLRRALRLYQEFRESSRSARVMRR